METEIKIDSGLLICPKCGTNGMGVFRVWKSMIQYNNIEKPVTTYIYYMNLSLIVFVFVLVIFFLLKINKKIKVEKKRIYQV